MFCIFATPKFTGQSYVFARAFGWSPPVIYTNSVSATATILTAAERAGAGALVNNTFTRAVLEGSGEPCAGRTMRDEVVPAGAVEVRAAVQRE